MKPIKKIDLNQVLIETGELDHFLKLLNLRCPGGREAPGVEPCVFAVFDELNTHFLNHTDLILEKEEGKGVFLKMDRDPKDLIHEWIQGEIVKCQSGDCRVPLI